MGMDSAKPAHASASDEIDDSDLDGVVGGSILGKIKGTVEKGIHGVESGVSSVVSTVFSGAPQTSTSSANYGDPAVNPKEAAMPK